MSDQFNLKKIIPLRTFATDAANARLDMPDRGVVLETAQQLEEVVQPKEKVRLPEKSDTLKTEMAQVGKAERVSILSDSGLTYESEEAAVGVIIRDKKRKRFKLFPAMVEASTAWFTGIQNDHKKRLERVPKVKTAESRIEVIEEAIRGSEQAPKEDYALVAQRLQNTERIPISTAISFKEKSEVPKPTWSSVASSEVQNDQSSIITTVPAIPIQGAVPKITRADTTHVPTLEEAPSHIEVTDVREQVIDTALDTLFDSTEETKVSSITEEATYVPPVKLSKVESPATTPLQYAPPRVYPRQKTLYLYLLIGVIIMSSLGGVLVTYYFFSLAKTSPIANLEQEILPPSQSLIQEQSSKVYTMPKTATEHILEIQKNVESSQAVTRFIPNLQIENGTREAAVEEILISLSLTAPASFLRSIKEVTLGGVDGTDMFIVLRVSTFDTAFAGMLSWEETIQSDLSPLFNTNQVRAITFTDTLTANKNTRLLQDSNGDDVITYTFTDKNTILITSTRTVLEQLIPLVK